MDRHTNMLSKRFVELHAQVVSDLSINQLNLKEKTLETPALKTKWLMIYFEEKRYLHKLKDALSIKVKEYVGQHGREGVPKRKTEDESVANVDIKKLRAAISEQEEIVEFLSGTGILKISGAFNFDIKNAIDIIKIESA